MLSADQILSLLALLRDQEGDWCDIDVRLQDMLLKMGWYQVAGDGEGGERWSTGVKFPGQDVTYPTVDLPARHA